MKLNVIVALCALFALSQQAPSSDVGCVCELATSEKGFPHDELRTVEDNASKCNSSITPQMTLELESLLLGLEQRLPQLLEDLATLEREDDGQLHAVLSLYVIENELTEIKELMDKLNSTSLAHQRLTTDATKQLDDMRTEMQELETYDTMQVVKRQKDNQRLKRDLDQCRNGLHSTVQPTQPPHGYCRQGQFQNVTGPRVYTAGEYPGSYPYGAWGQDPKPEAGRESWYWLVMLTSSNVFSNYVRRYSSLSTLIVGDSGSGELYDAAAEGEETEPCEAGLGSAPIKLCKRRNVLSVVVIGCLEVEPSAVEQLCQTAATVKGNVDVFAQQWAHEELLCQVTGNVQISSSNPTTNTIQGPNVVMYAEALYYNCYYQDAVCRFNLTTKAVTNLQLPEGTRYNSAGNFCHLDECYPYTDLDLATDESGVWVIYTTKQNFGNLVLSKVEEGEPLTLGQTWNTSVYKKAVTNTFMMCGVLYATRYVSKEIEEIFYSFDTTTGAERFNVGIFIKKMAANIYSLNYSPVDQMLHAYCDSYMVSYEVLFS